MSGDYNRMVANMNGLSNSGAQSALTYGFGGITYGAVSSTGPTTNKVAEPVVRTIKPPKRCIEILREEITDWHGSILK